MIAYFIYHQISDFRLYHIIHKLLLNLFAIIDAIKIQWFIINIFDNIQERNKYSP